MSSGGKRLRILSDGSKRKRVSSKGNQVLSVPRGLRTYLSKRGTPNGVHEFRRTVWQSFNVNNTGMQVPAGGTYQPEFAMRFDVGGVVMTGFGVATSSLGLNYSELAALFDQIKLDKVEVMFYSKNDSSQPTAGVTNSEAIRIATAIDYNDDTPISESQLREYGSFQMDVIEPGGKQHKRTLKPMFNELVSYTGGAGNVGYRAMRGYVASSASAGTGVAMYGLKGNITGPTSAVQLLVSVTYNYKCKNIR